MWCAERSSGPHHAQATLQVVALEQAPKRSAWHRALALGVSTRLAAPRSHVAKTLDDAALEYGLATYPTVARALKQPVPPALEPAAV